MSQNQQEQSEAKLLAYLEGELDPAARGEIEKHLEAHPQHRRLLEEMKGMRDWVRWLPRESAPPDLVETFQGQLERAVLLGPVGGESPDPRMRINRWPQIRAAAAVAALAVGLGAAVYFALPPTRNSPYSSLPSVPPTTQKLALRTASTRPTTELADSLTVAPAAVRSDTADEDRSDNKRNERSIAGDSPAPERPLVADAGAAPEPGSPTPFTVAAGAPSPAEMSDAAAKEAEGMAHSEPTGHAAASASDASPAQSLAPAPSPPPALSAVAEAERRAEPSEQMEQVARQTYLSMNVPNNGLAAPNLQRADMINAVDNAVDSARRTLAADRKSEKSSADRGASPLVMVVLAPDTDRARQQIDDYLATNHIPAPGVLGSRAAPGGAGTGGGGASGAIGAAAPPTAAVHPAGGSGAMAKSIARPSEGAGPNRVAATLSPSTPSTPTPAAGPGPAASPRTGSRAGEVARREMARVPDEANPVSRVPQHTAPAPAAPSAAPAPLPARAPRTGGAAAPASLPNGPVAGNANLARGAGVAGVAGAGETPSVEGRGRLPSSPLPTAQFPDPSLDNSVGGVANAQKSFAFTNRGAIQVRMTARQASDLQASLRQPGSSQWAAVYGEPEELQQYYADGQAELEKQANGGRRGGAASTDPAPRQEFARDDRGRDGLKGSSSSAPGGSGGAGEKSARFGTAAATRPAGFAPGAATAPASPAAPMAAAAGTQQSAAKSQERLRDATAGQRPPSPPLVPAPRSQAGMDGIGPTRSAPQPEALAAQEQAERQVRQGDSPATGPVRVLNNEEQPLDVVIVLQQSPPPTAVPTGGATDPSGATRQPGARDSAK